MAVFSAVPTRQHDGAPRDAVLKHIDEVVVGAPDVVGLRTGENERGADLRTAAVWSRFG